MDCILLGPVLPEPTTAVSTLLQLAAKRAENPVAGHVHGHSCGSEHSHRNLRPATFSPGTAAGAGASVGVAIAGEDGKATLFPIRACVLTVSDRVSRGEAEDRSGPEACRLLGQLPGQFIINCLHMCTSLYQCIVRP